MSARIEGGFWTGWVLAEQNKPGEQENKRSLFRMHLDPALGSVPLDAIGVTQVQELKAALAVKLGRTGRPLSKKTINGVLAVLSKMLSYAEECGVIDEAPRVRLHKVPLPEVQAWEFDEYARLLEASTTLPAPWSTAVLLAGDSGLRLGELLALEWGDVDLEGSVLTIRRQLRRRDVGTPKGGRVRVVPMTARLQRHLRGLAQIRTGRVLRDAAGSCELEGIAKHIIYDVSKAAALPRRAWHTLRHSNATHLAHFGVNPWSLQSWLGHTSIEMTLRYVRYAERYRSVIPPAILAAGYGHANPDERALAMLGARGPELIGVGGPGSHRDRQLPRSL